MLKKQRKNSKKPRLLIVGSEGLIGKRLVRHYQDRFDVLEMDYQLGHDVTDEKFLSKWFRENKNLHGMIIAHGYNPVARKSKRKIEPMDVSLGEIRKYLDVNTVSVFDLCRNFIKNNKKGAIVNITSLYGHSSPRHYIYNNFVKPIGYSLSKAALVMLTKYLATYYAPNFRINTVTLGGVKGRVYDPVFVARYSSHVPMRRLMDISELLSAFDFLLDERSSYVTGTEIFVDGGWTAW